MADYIEQEARNQQCQNAQPGLTNIGLILLGIAAAIVILGLIRKGARAGAQLAADRVREIQAEKREEREYQKQLRRELERVETIERARNNQQLDLYRKQIELLAEYKQKEADITAEQFAMRQKLLELEAKENDAMVRQLIKTLDSI